MLDIMKGTARLALNWSKTVVVNFSKYSELQLRRLIGQVVPLVMGVKLARFARYLGSMVGPEAFQHAWGGPRGPVGSSVRELGMSDPWGAQ